MKSASTAVVVGAQWGDEGKGKIVDVLSENFAVVARYAGGHNAGHTVIRGDKKFILQLIPCGILRPGCRAVIGNGVVLDPMALLRRSATLREAGDCRQRAGRRFIRFRAAESLHQQSRAPHPALSPHDRTGGGERAGTGQDRHHLARHRAGVRGQDGTPRAARRRPARSRAAAQAHRQRLRGEEHDRARAVQHRTPRSRRHVRGVRARRRSRWRPSSATPRCC